MVDRAGIACCAILFRQALRAVLHTKRVAAGADFDAIKLLKFARHNESLPAALRLSAPTPPAFLFYPLAISAFYPIRCFDLNTSFICLCTDQSKHIHMEHNFYLYTISQHSRIRELSLFLRDEATTCRADPPCAEAARAIFSILLARSLNVLQLLLCCLSVLYQLAAPSHRDVKLPPTSAFTKLHVALRDLPISANVDYSPQYIFSSSVSLPFNLYHSTFNFERCTCNSLKLQNPRSAVKPSALRPSRGVPMRARKMRERDPRAAAQSINLVEDHAFGTPGDVHFPGLSQLCTLVYRLLTMLSER